MHTLGVPPACLSLGIAATMAYVWKRNRYFDRSQVVILSPLPLLYLLQALLWNTKDFDMATAQSCSTLNQYLSLGVFVCAGALPLAFCMAAQRTLNQMKKIGDDNPGKMQLVKVTRNICAASLPVLVILIGMQFPENCSYNTRGHMTWTMIAHRNGSISMGLWNPAYILMIFSYAMLMLTLQGANPRPIGQCLVFNWLFDNILLGMILKDGFGMTMLGYLTSTFISTVPSDNYIECFDMFYFRGGVYLSIFLLTMPATIDFVVKHRLDQKLPFGHYLCENFPSFIKVDQELCHNEGVPLLGGKSV